MDDWDEYLGGQWADALRTVPNTGTVIEIGPGYGAKVAHGLARLNFCGTILLVEPDPMARESASQAYRRLLPDATVLTQHRPVPEVGCFPGQHVDVLAGNHVVDDLLLRAAYPENVSLFTLMRPGSPCSSLFIRSWHKLLDEPGRLARVMRQVVGEVASYVRANQPRRVVLNQYPSWRHDECGLAVIHETSLRALLLMAAEFGPAAEHSSSAGKMTWLTVRVAETSED
ncbi:hypothetical protein AB0C38_11585 [Amycolatopsis sp. NPDC048633]|uniref:hypothetical protein n=1 Tax=Amycolatopsis sp. NPDC048633 TaxID=3157095 RepID=UPI0033C3B222